MLADNIEEVFDTIQIEAYESEVYRAYSGIDATKLDYVNEALRINKIGIDGLEKIISIYEINNDHLSGCLLYTSPSPRDRQKSRMPSSA